MITRKQIIERCLENENKKFTDGGFTFKLFKNNDKQEDWDIEALSSNNYKFNLWNHQQDNQWYLNSLYLTNPDSQSKFNDYIKLLDYLQIEYQFDLPIKEKIIAKIVVQEKVNNEREEFLKGQIATYERLLTPFKNLNT